LWYNLYQLAQQAGAKKSKKRLLTVIDEKWGTELKTSFTTQNRAIFVAVLVCFVSVWLTYSCVAFGEEYDVIRLQKQKEVLYKNGLTLSQYFKIYFDREGNCTAVGNDTEYLLLDESGNIKRKVRIEDSVRQYEKTVEGTTFKYKEESRNFLSIDGKYISTVKIESPMNIVPETDNYRENPYTITLVYLSRIDGASIWQKTFQGEHRFNVDITPEGERAILWTIEPNGKGEITIYDQDGSPGSKLEFFQFEHLQLSEEGSVFGVLARESRDDEYKSILFYDTKTAEKLYDRHLSGCSHYDDNVACDNEYFRFISPSVAEIINISEGITEKINITSEKVKLQPKETD
jgi:hypothetical protein